MNTAIKNVAIVGGTHGNEYTGAYLLRHWQKSPTEVTRPSFTTRLFFGNPKAFAENRRFIDQDLNRSFALEALTETDLPAYEASRALVLNQAIGPKGRPQHDFLIDLHSSTSNCGAMIILLDDNPFNLRLTAYLTVHVPEAKIHYIPPRGGDQPYLGSVCAAGLSVEVGPIPQSILRQDMCALSRRLVTHTLDYLHLVNLQNMPTLPKQVEVYRFQETVPFPEEDSLLAATIHESLQDRDYEPLNPGAPMFRRFDGTVIHFEGPNTVYPVFINEAAYYYKRIAMSLTRKEVIAVPS